MAQTALQELQEFIKVMKVTQTLLNGCNIETVHIPSLEHKITELLPKERQGIIDCGKAFANFNGIDDTDIEYYFTQTYNQK